MRDTHVASSVVDVLRVATDGGVHSLVIEKKIDLRVQWVAGIKKTGCRGTPPFLSLSTALIHPTPWFLSSGRGTQSSQSAGPKDF